MSADEKQVLVEQLVELLNKFQETPPANSSTYQLAHHYYELCKSAAPVVSAAIATLGAAVPRAAEEAITDQSTTTYVLDNPNDAAEELERLRKIQAAALRVASSRHDGIVTDQGALDLLDEALESQ